MSENQTVTSPADILRAARELISTPEKWTQEWYSRDESGEWVSLSTASCFCAVGALARASGLDDASDFEDRTLSKFFERAIGASSIVNWNDDKDRTHAEILAGFDRAIALAEQAAS